LPTYGYRCPKCSLEFDVWQRMSDEPSATCPSCGAASRRLFFPAGIVFKGTGFYKTDSRKASTGGDGAAPKPSSGGGSKKDDAKTDSKAPTSSTSTPSD
jgi:putative FmdB family regulatory protein